MEKTNQAIVDYIQNNQNEIKQKLTKEQKYDNLLDNIARFRADLPYFNEEYLGIHNALFQKQIITTMSDNDVSDIIASRGLSKSFLVAEFALDIALLYPSSEILITSMTLAQSNLIINEKIKNGFCAEGTMFSSPVLCQLRKDKWITFHTDENTGGLVVLFKNGSWIKAVVCGEGARGNRSTCIITDEFMLVKKKDYDEIIAPTQHPRMFAGRPNNYPEPSRQIFLSSARTRTSWGYNHLKNCIEQHYKNKHVNYGFFLGDIYTAIANGILTKKQYLQRKKACDSLSWSQEYLNEFLGNSEDSIFKYEDFEQNQKIESAFYPRTQQDIIDCKEQTYKFRDNEIRYLTVDVAVATGDENDNTVIVLGKINKTTGKKSVEYLDAINGMNSIQQVTLMKRLFYEYKCSYFVIDARGVGATLWDLFTVETVDEEFGKTYPAWTVNVDKELQISSDTVINDKIIRAMTPNAKEVMIPIVGTAELNSMIHLSFRKALKDGDIQLLLDSYDKQARLEEKDPMFIMKSSEEKADILIPFVQTRFMINEAVALEVKFSETGLIKLQEAKRTSTKDRYMAVAYMNLFGDKLVNKYCKINDNDDDFDWDNISLVF